MVFNAVRDSKWSDMTMNGVLPFNGLGMCPGSHSIKQEYRTQRIFFFNWNNMKDV